jgi:hypothetical protein
MLKVKAAGVNAKNRRGRTALHHAAMNDHEERCLSFSRGPMCRRRMARELRRYIMG